jgi:hypothetical protein
MCVLLIQRRAATARIVPDSRAAGKRAASGEGALLFAAPLRKRRDNEARSPAPLLFLAPVA